jgi:tetratricopeptide (TPR) repeat protein
LSRYCSAALEACWLVAIVTIPLVFNTYSFANFEPDKAALLRAISLLMALAWTVDWLERRRLRAEVAWWRPGRETWAGLPADRTARLLVLCAGILLSAHAVASLWSLSPAISLWGSYRRAQGLDTLVSYGLVFITIATHLRRREQVERAFSAMIFAACAIALYGLLQQHGTDPLPWSGKARVEVRSTMGNEIFLGAYLIGTLTVTAYRLTRAAEDVLPASEVAGRRLRILLLVGLGLLTLAWWRSIPIGTAAMLAALGVLAVVSHRCRRSYRRGLAIGTYVAVFSVQLSCLLMTQSRGPALGLAAALLILALAVAVVGARVWLGRAIIALAVLALLTVALRDVPGSPSAFLADVPGVGRLTKIFVPTGSAQVRLLLWRSGSEALAASPMRTMIGRGPETQHLVLSEHYPAGLDSLGQKGSIVDRAHNESLDLVLGSGLIALAAYWALIVLAVIIALRAIGELRDPRSSWRFVVLTIVGVAAAAIGMRLVDGEWRLIWIALPLGVTAAPLLWLSARAAIGRRPPAKRAPPVVEALVAATLLAALLGNLVEAHFGIATVSTRLHFWVLMAMFVALARGVCHPKNDCLPVGVAGEEVHNSDAGQENLSGSKARATGFEQAAVILVVIVTVTLCYDFSRASGGVLGNPGLTWLFGACWTLLGLLIAGEYGSAKPSGDSPLRWIERAGFYFGGCLVVLAIARMAFSDQWQGGQMGNRVLFGYLLFAGLAMIRLAGALLKPRGPNAHHPTVPRQVLYGLLAGIVLLGAWLTSVPPIQADIHYSRARVAHQGDRDYLRAIAAYEQAVALAPTRVTYLLDLAVAWTDRAKAQPSPSARNASFERARAVLMSARAKRPLDPEYLVNLARLNLTWGEHATSGARRRDLLREAERQFGKAVESSPRHASLWNEWGRAARVRGKPQIALLRHRHALNLDPGLRVTQAHLGDAYSALGEWESARHAYEQSLDSGLNNAALQANLARSLAHLALYEQAVSHQAEAVRLEPDQAGRRVMLMMLYLDAGECESALAQARRSSTELPLTAELRVVLRHVFETCGTEH